jgi:hypothetical protein
VSRAAGFASLLLALVALAPADAGAQPALELLPDLDQRPPYGVVVHATAAERFRLGFGSAVDNVGAGPLVLAGRRASTAEPTMAVNQRVALSNGEARVYEDVGTFAYVTTPTHSHWHYEPFSRYELRRADTFERVALDRKTGFCLSDRHASTLPTEGVPPEPLFVGYCGRSRPNLLRLVEGASVGYSDRYPANREGQYLDVTGVDAGLYVLVHRTNWLELLVESDYENNAASALVRLSWPRGRSHAPRAQVLARCERSETCGGMLARR